MCPRGRAPGPIALCGDPVPGQRRPVTNRRRGRPHPLPRHGWTTRGSLGGARPRPRWLAPQLVGHRCLPEPALPGGGPRPGGARAHPRRASDPGHRGAPTVAAGLHGGGGGHPGPPDRQLDGRSGGGIAGSQPNPTRWPVSSSSTRHCPPPAWAWSTPGWWPTSCCVPLPGVGEGYLAQRRRRTSAEQSVRRVLAVCCVDPLVSPPRWCRPMWTSPSGWTGPGPMMPISVRPDPCPCSWPARPPPCGSSRECGNPPCCCTGSATCWFPCPPLAG